MKKKFIFRQIIWYLKFDKGKTMAECKNFCSIQIDEDQSIKKLTADIIARIQPEPSYPCSIYRVPDKLRVEDDDRYKPTHVSIGPYHSKNPKLKAAEKKKMWFLRDLLCRAKAADISLEDIVKAIKDLEVRARNSYAEEIDLSSDEFVTMMVIDGCFILETLYKAHEFEDMQKDHEKGGEENDRINPKYGEKGICHAIQRDLVLLENQLPFIVLERLFKLTKDPNHGSTLYSLAMMFFSSMLPTDTYEVPACTHTKHLLDLLRSHLLTSCPPMAFGKNPYKKLTNYCAIKLREAGVKIKRKEKAGLLDITFSEDGILEIPPIFYGSGVSILIPNIIALEQCHRCYADEITSYAIFLHSLIGSKDDVKFLRSEGIINVNLERNERLAAEIDSLNKGVSFRTFYYHDLCKRIKAHTHKHKWKVNLNKWHSILKREYLGSPWKVLSILAAILLLLLTLTQTFYSVMSYSQTD